MNKKFACIDLFSGAGGLSKGFLDAGYNVVLGVDFDDAALTTFKANHGTSEVMKLDLFSHNNIEKIVSFLEEKEIELDVIQTNDGIGAKRIVDDFAKIGYNMVSKLLFAPDYGVPQIRKRVFFVGLKDSGTVYSFPEKTTTPDKYVTCEQAISDLPSLQLQDGNIIYGEEIQEYATSPQTDYQKNMRKNSKLVYNHIGSIPIEKTKKMLSMIPEGKNYKALPDEYRCLYKYHEALTRYHSKKPSLTINTGHRSHFHYKYDRIPTVRESARLQSFPDDFVFYGNKSQQYKQVGNAVPPMLGYAVAKKLLEYLK